MLVEFIYNLSKIEDRQNLFEPSYLRMDSDEKEASRVCADCEKCYTPENYCHNVLSRMEDKEAVLSACNRILDALLKRGHWVMSGCFDPRVETVTPCDGEVKLDWGGEYGEDFCRRCRLYGKEKCPEDVHDEECARNMTARAVEHVISAVNELI